MEHFCYTQPCEDTSLDLNEAMFYLEGRRVERDYAIAHYRDRAQAVKPLWKVVTILIAVLSGSTSLAHLYLLNMSLRTSLSEEVIDLTLDGSLLQTWLSRAAVARSVQTSWLDDDSKHMFLAKKFLIESIVVQYVLRRSRNGVLVPFHMVFLLYVRYWQLLDPRGRASKHLRDLIYGKSHYKRNWARDLRRTWPLTWGSNGPAPTLQRDSIIHRVPRLLCHLTYTLLLALCF